MCVEPNLSFSENIENYRSDSRKTAKQFAYRRNRYSNSEDFLQMTEAQRISPTDQTIGWLKIKL